MNKVVKWVAIGIQGFVAVGMLVDGTHRLLYGGLLLLSVLLTGFLPLLTPSKWRRVPKQSPDEPMPDPNVPPPKPKDRPREPSVRPAVPVSREPVSYFENYLSCIKDKYGLDAKGRMRADVEALLGGAGCVGRINEVLSASGTHRVRGLVCGHCQEGKSGHFTGVIAKALDEKYNIVIVLTTCNTSLMKQTLTRLQGDLADSGLVEGRYALVDFLSSSLPSLDGLDEGKIYVGVALKQADHLRGRNGNGKGIAGWLEANSAFLAKARVLVIDDEADAVSQNSKPGPDDWSESAVLDLANRIESEGQESGEVKLLRISEWLRRLVEDDFPSSISDDARSEIKEVLDCRLSPGEVPQFIKKYGSALGIEVNVQAGAIPALLSGFISSYFEQAGNTGSGHSRADEFRGVLRWWLGIRRERSVINQALCDLVRPRGGGSNFDTLVYLGYTATPFACFLNERRGADNPLELDFAFSMTRSPAYLGLSEIFGSDRTGTPRLPIVRTIPETEHENVTWPFLAGGEDVEVDANLNYCRKDGDWAEWTSLREAIAWAFCAAALRRQQRLERGVSDTGDESWPQRCTTMLINLSRKVCCHGNLKSVVDQYVKEVVKVGNWSSFRELCLEVFDERVKDLDVRRFKEILPTYPLAVSDAQRRVVESNLDDVMGHVQVIALNSDEENDSAYDLYVQDVPQHEKRSGDWLWIVVGGDRISRGLTFHGLVSSYFDRDKPTVNVDTLLQMGRWLGYRVGYELLPRVWMPKGTVESLQDICRLEDDLHIQIKAGFERGETSPNPKMMLISRRLTGRDAGKETVSGVENLFVTRSFKFGNGESSSAVRDLAEFLTSCGTPEQGSGRRIFERLNKWRGVSKAVVESYLNWMSCQLSAGECDNLRRVMSALGTEMVDVVLADPQNDRLVCELGASGLSVHPHGISEVVSLPGGGVCFPKFAGQYDSWKAFPPTDIVDAVEQEYGIRGNTQEALDEMFRQASLRGMATRPILQVGLIDAEGEALGGTFPYAAFYWPSRDEIVVGTTTGGNVVNGNDIPPEVQPPSPPVERKPIIPAEPRRSSANGLNDAKRDAIRISLKEPERKPTASTVEPKRCSTNGLDDAEKDAIRRVLEELAKADRPWYKRNDLYDLIKEALPRDFPGRLAIIERFICEQSDWVRAKTDFDGGWFFAPKEFCGDKGALENVRGLFRSVVRDVLCEKGDGQWTSGEACWSLVKEKLNAGGAGTFDSKIKAILSPEKTLPTKKHGSREVRERLQDLLGIETDVYTNNSNVYYRIAHVGR